MAQPSYTPYEYDITLHYTPKIRSSFGHHTIKNHRTNIGRSVLTNNKTAYNIDAMIERLDATYADQRPLYIVEAEMTSIKQMGKSLQE